MGNIVTDTIIIAGLPLPAHRFGVAKIESMDFSDDSVPFSGLMGFASSVRYTRICTTAHRLSTDRSCPSSTLPPPWNLSLRLASSRKLSPRSRYLDWLIRNTMVRSRSADSMKPSSMQPLLLPWTISPKKVSGRLTCQKSPLTGRIVV